MYMSNSTRRSIIHSSCMLFRTYMYIYATRFKEFTLCQYPEKNIYIFMYIYLYTYYYI